MIGALLVADVHFGELEILGPHAFGSGLLVAGTVANAIYVVHSKRPLEGSTPIRVLFWTQLAGLALSLPFMLLGAACRQSGELRCRHVGLADVYRPRVFYGEHGRFLPHSDKTRCRSNHDLDLLATGVWRADGTLSY